MCKSKGCKHKGKIRQWHWQDPVYNVAIMLIKGDGEAAGKWLDETFNDGEKVDHGQFLGGKTFWVTDPGCALVIWLPEWWKADSSFDLGVLAHECVHGASYVLQARGVQFHGASEEAFTYYVTFLFQNCHKRLADA